MTVVRRGPLNSQGNLNHSCYQSGLLGVVTCIPVALESSSSLQNSSRLSVSSDETNTGFPLIVAGIYVEYWQAGTHTIRSDAF